MKLLHRYVFRSVGIATLTGIGLFTFVLIAGNAVHDGLDLLTSGQLTFPVFLRLTGLLLPWTISFAAPLGLLIGVLLVLGRMSARHEIVAIKAAGISIWRLSAPILAVALLAVAAGTAVNNFYGPTARNQYLAVLRHLAQDNPLRFIVPGRFVRDFPGYVIYAGGREGDALTNFWVWETNRDGEAIRLLRARSGTFTLDAGRESLVLTLHDGFAEARSESDPRSLKDLGVGTFVDWRLRLPLEQLFARTGHLQTDLRQRRLSDMSLPDLLTLRQQYARELATAGATPAVAARDRLERTRASYYISRNFAFAYSPLALAFLAIPLGIKASRTETYANLGIALALALFYYFLVFLAGMLERNPAALPQAVVWLPNLGFQAAGLWLMRRANRH